MRQTQSYQGWTLIELMLSVSITSTLLAIAVPNLQDFLIRMRVDNEISQLHRMLLITRNAAINSGTKAILCPIEDSGACSSNWHNQLSAFIDYNNNQVFDPLTEKILVVKDAIKTNDKLLYAKYRNKITYTPTGHLSGLTNGTFRYCPTQNLSLARGIIIATSGRLYATSDKNNDGVDENRSGKKLNCE
ncbi:GspH/FimT family pseudopilin [Colwellia sp. MEBiC06753]